MSPGVSIRVESHERFILKPGGGYLKDAFCSSTPKAACMLHQEHQKQYRDDGRMCAHTHSHTNTHEMAPQWGRRDLDESINWAKWIKATHTTTETHVDKALTLLLQCAAVCCSMLQRVPLDMSLLSCRRVDLCCKRVAVCCSVVQCVEACCSQDLAMALSTWLLRLGLVLSQ